MRRLLLSLLAVLAIASPAFGQSQAINGTIEGTVVDASGAVLPGVTVTLTNTDTGAVRSVVTNERGVYRAPLLPLGTYRVVAELEGFKKFEQAGVNVSAGRTAVIDVTMGVGSLNETVSVTADSPIVDPAKIDLGRNLNEREVKNLPLVSRNPYNFALLQPGVSGYENSEFGVPRFSANGTLLRINYQIDGNTNTQKDRAGLRLLPISEVMVREVKVVTSGYAPEFGQTTGLVYNVVTPSGTNQLRGNASYRGRRKSFSARPFYFNNTATITDKPDTYVNTFTAEVGGPIVRDKTHFFVGYERTSRDLSADRVITISSANAAAIGLTSEEASGVMPASQAVSFLMPKVDLQLGPSHRLMGRYILFRNDSPNNINAGLTSTQWATDFTDAMDSAAAQLVSTFGATKLNEVRVQFARRHQSRVTNDLSGTGPAIRITGVADFGGPYFASQDAGFDFKQNIWQVIENFTWIAGDHNFKVGADLQFVDDERTTTPIQSYSFASLAAYQSALSGATPRSYSNFGQFIGPLDFSMATSLYSFFVQDDWRVNSDFKLLYGVRYDLYQYPDGDPSAPFEYSQEYNVAKSNFGPRLGVAWTLGSDKRTVLRASTGLMFDQPLLAAYENAVQQNGVRSATVSLTPTSPGAPPFPTVLSGTSGITLRAPTIFTVDPEFTPGRTFQNNVQIDRALGSNYSAQVGFVFVKGYDLPVITDINLINPIGQLADGRPIYSSTVSAATRMDPRFDHINTVQSVGESTYRGMTFQLTRRFSGGMQFDFTYAIGKGTDNAPLTSVLSVQGDDGRSDPSNLDRDEGPNLLDTRHTFAGSFVAQPTVNMTNDALNAILNDNQLGIMVQLNSGLPFTIRSNRDLNQDGVASDRPLDIGRNSMYLPNRYNMDLRYSRFIPINGRVRAEVQAEFKNVFNNRQTFQVNRVVTTDIAGNPAAPIPGEAEDFPIAGRSGFEARQFQLGFKVSF
jgi:hypothetical protein